MPTSIMQSNSIHSTRITVLLSLNAAAILIAGVLIASAIWLNGGVQFRAVDERSDVIAGNTANTTDLIVPVTDSTAEVATAPLSIDDYISSDSHEFDSSSVPAGELWNENTITIYATPDIDICVGGGLSNLGELYWQTSDPNVIAGFYDSARNWLGYSDDTCRYPVIKSTGTVVITAGTYDGLRKDSLVVTVIDPPVQQWMHDVLTIVNKLRVKNNLRTLSWGDTCAEAAMTRAAETKELYAHTRPDGSDWSTACPAPAGGGVGGENLAIGNAAVSPATVVSLWMNSPSHRANILNPDYTKLAVGFIYDPNTNYRTYWSQFFSTY